MRLMYDSITLGEIPRNAQAVAGYVGGHWPTYPQLVRIWPKANLLSIAVSANEKADCLDCEAGDVNPGDYETIHTWVREALDRGVARPVIYSSRAYMGGIVRHLEEQGLRRNRFRVWSAHYGDGAHICSPSSCGADFTADGTQWTDNAQGRNLDESLLHDDFFPQAAPKPARKPVPKVSAAGLSGLITAGIMGALHAGGLVHLSPGVSGVVDAMAAFLAGYVKRG